VRVTQRDIARLAEVSQATVSRVLSGDVRVEHEIRDRVLAVMQQKNYQPDVRARALRNQKSGLIGLVIKRPQGGIANDPFYANLISYLVEELSGRDYHLCVDVASDEFYQVAIYDELLRTRRVDGLILVESEAADDRIRRLQAEGFPFVLLGNPLHFAEVHSVDNDNVIAAEEVTNHMIEQGYKRVGFLGARAGITVSDDRIAGYQRALRGKQAEHLVYHSAFGSESSRRLATDILKSSERPDALVVLDDFMAFGVATAARDMGLQIPRDLGIASFNDTSLCEMIGGGLTSVNLNIQGLVSKAVHRLSKIIDDKPILTDRRIIVPTTLTVRSSSLRSEVLK
jgi:DNA-binding LacI/PurR family transcriptional regulator